MRLWLVEIGEILPLDEGARVMRTGLLAQQLVAAGHEVVWWADAFNHFRKTFRSDGFAKRQISPGLTLHLLHGPAYSSNISLNRHRNHLAVARQFRELASREPEPEVIYCGYPTVELAYETALYAQARHIPLSLDVRDPWPDLLLRYLPRGTRWLGRVALQRYYRLSRATLKSATVLTATSDAFLNWALERAQRPRAPGDEVFYLAYNASDGDQSTPLELPDLPELRVRCLFVGGFGPAYDLTTVIDAARKLEESGSAAVQFVIAGDGPRAAELRARAAGLKTVHFCGWLSGPQIRTLLSVSDVGLVAVAPLALTSVPNKSFEYMSGGLAVLNTTTGDLRELIEKQQFGLNYAAGQADDLVAKVRQLIERPDELAAMKRNARTLFHERFEAAQVYRRFADKLVGLSARAAGSIRT